MNTTQILWTILLGLLLAPMLYAQTEAEAADPLLEVYHCGNVYEWSLSVDQDGDGRHDDRLYRTCDGVLSCETDSLTVWQQIVNKRELVEVGNALPTLLKVVSDSGTMWYVEERDAESGAVICRSTLIDGYVKTDCEHKLIGTPCFFDIETARPNESESKRTTEEKKEAIESMREVEKSKFEE